MLAMSFLVYWNIIPNKKYRYIEKITLFLNGRVSDCSKFMKRMKSSEGRNEIEKIVTTSKLPMISKMAFLFSLPLL
jgi:hypothetical protein